MTIKSMLWALFCTLSIACMLASCQSSKIAYGNSYYFKQTPKPVVKSQPIPTVEAMPQSDELHVTTEKAPLIQEEVETLIAKARRQMIETAEKSDHQALKEQAYKIDHLTRSMKEGNLSKKEMRGERRALRKEMRSLIQEYRAAPEEMKAMDRTLRLTLILAGLGLLLLIIGGATYGTTVGAVFSLLGLLALIGALVAFIIWAVNA